MKIAQFCTSQPYLLFFLYHDLHTYVGYRNIFSRSKEELPLIKDTDILGEYISQLYKHDKWLLSYIPI
jgi:hypothetical protein